MSNQEVPNNAIFPELITATLLKSRNISVSQLGIFVFHFPNGMVVNKQNIYKASEVGLYLPWLVEKLATGNAYGNVLVLTSQMNLSFSFRKAFAEALITFLDLK